jgi:hypothetical protein
MSLNTPREVSEESERKKAELVFEVEPEGDVLHGAAADAADGEAETAGREALEQHVAAAVLHAE